MSSTIQPAFIDTINLRTLRQVHAKIAAAGTRACRSLDARILFAYHRVTLTLNVEPQFLPLSILQPVHAQGTAARDNAGIAVYSRDRAARRGRIEHSSPDHV